MIQDETTLVVIEYGASWPRWLDPGQNRQLAVVAQHYEGEPSSLVAQVASRITRLEARGWRLGRIVLVVNDRTDSDAFAARSVLARGLLARLQRRHAGELVLCAEEPAKTRTCQTLTGLAAALDADAVGWGVGVAVRIGGRPALLGAASGWALAHAS